jgi:tetratricopeptide (TPR) repeat protein
MDTAAELENARALRRLGRHKAAAEICQKILDRQPNHADALLVLGTIADDLRDSRSAIGFLTRAVDQDSKLPGAGLLLADLLARLGIVDSAIAWYRVALEIEADAPRAAPALAQLLAAGNRLGEIAALARQQRGQGRPAIALEIALIARAAAPAEAEIALLVGEMLIAENLARPWTGKRQPWCNALP